MFRYAIAVILFFAAGSSFAKEDAAVRLCGLVKKVGTTFEFSIGDNSPMIVEGANTPAQNLLESIYALTVGNQNTRLRACLHGDTLPVINIDNDMIQYRFYFGDVTPFVAEEDPVAGVGAPEGAADMAPAPPSAGRMIESGFTTEN